MSDEFFFFGHGAPINLALTQSIPAFLDVVRAILGEMLVEEAIIAEEMIEYSLDMYQALMSLLGNILIYTVSHENFKTRTTASRAIIRTGEFTPYANVILAFGGVF